MPMNLTFTLDEFNLPLFFQQWTKHRKHKNPAPSDVFCKIFDKVIFDHKHTCGEQRSRGKIKWCPLCKTHYEVMSSDVVFISVDWDSLDGYTRGQMDRVINDYILKKCRKIKCRGTTVIEIPPGSGNRYKYVYEGGKTVYKGPVRGLPETDIFEPHIIIPKYDLTLDGWIEELKRTQSPDCPTCGTELDFHRLKYYDHSDGQCVDGFPQRQWLYVECPGCEYQWAINKLAKKNEGRSEKINR